ncbi:MAG: heme ABC exporter ATP-binding protein CcmA [Pseudomonadota bacterium]
MTLKVHDLSLARGGVPVLTGVRFDLARGQAAVLRGPNGAGKTTLLRALAGLQPATAGVISLDPEDTAYAGHADGIKSTLTVSENLRFWARIFGQRDIAPALQAYGLEPLAERPAGALSAGQKRRLGLARLLVAGRALWLLDEPTVSLDTAAVAMFAATLSAHLTSGGSALIATHIDLGVEAKVIDISPWRAKADTVVGASEEAFL